MLPEDFLLLMIQYGPFDLSLLKGIEKVYDSDAVVEKDPESLPPLFG